MEAQVTLTNQILNSLVTITQMQIVTLKEDQGEKLIGLRVSIDAASYLETIINITELGAFYFCTRKI